MTANGADLEPRVIDLEDWRADTQGKLERDIPLILGGIDYLKSIYASIATKVGVASAEATRAADTAEEAKKLAEAALVQRDSVGPKVRAKMASFSTEVEEATRNATAEIERVASRAAASKDPGAIKAMIVEVLQAQALAEQAKAYNDWKKTVIAVAKRITWGLLAVAGAGVLHALRLAWQVWTHH